MLKWVECSLRKFEKHPGVGWSSVSLLLPVSRCRPRFDCPDELMICVFFSLDLCAYSVKPFCSLVFSTNHVSGIETTDICCHILQ